MIYVASSWRCERHGEVVKALRAVGLETYDFKDPETCFKWSDVVPSIREHGADLTPRAYWEALSHPRAEAGFNQDMDALERATTVILVHPAGRSAHLEMGYAVGRSKNTALLVEQRIRDMDLMVCMIQNLYSDLDLLVKWAQRSERVLSRNHGGY